MLPADLRRAEAEALGAIQAALESGQRGLWTVELRFEGLRLLPLALGVLISGASLGGQTRARMCELAGVETDAAPMSMAPTGYSQSWPEAMIKRLPPIRNSVIWLIRTGP